jgi:hypothetical protein
MVAMATDSGDSKTAAWCAASREKAEKTVKKTVMEVKNGKKNNGFFAFSVGEVGGDWAVGVCGGVVE